MEARAERTKTGRWVAVVRHRTAIAGARPFDQTLPGEYQHRQEAIEEAVRFIRIVNGPQRAPEAPARRLEAVQRGMHPAGRPGGLWRA